LKILVSPAEPAEIKRQLRSAITNAVTHSLPEKYGADFLMMGPPGRLAVQRKTIEDLLASVEDGRLAREIVLLKRTQFPVLLVEGRPVYTTEGNLISPYRSRFTRKQIRNIIRSVQFVHGISVERTDSVLDTVGALQEMAEWFTKGEHRSLLGRPKRAARNAWYTREDRDWGRFLLQGFPGIGSTLAEAIFDHFGRVPLRWDCTKEELLEIEGIGKKRAGELWRMLE